MEANQVHLAVHTDEPAELRRHYREIGGIAFSSSVVDLEALGYQLVGGTVVQLGTYRSTLGVYRSARGMLLCHRIWAPDMPVLPGGETVGGDTLHTVNGIAICMHREGDVVCFMASALPRVEFIKQLTGKA